jgi:galactose-1-phosphate uridylyltransferase
MLLITFLSWFVSFIPSLTVLFFVLIQKRFVGRNRSVVAITPFSPRGSHEVHLFVPGVTSIVDLTKEQCTDLADAFIKVLKGYASLGVGSFNMASFSSSTKSDAQLFTLHFKFFSRPYPAQVYTNDTGSTERLYDDFVVNTIPEQYSAALAAQWTSKV